MTIDKATVHIDRRLRIITVLLSIMTQMAFVNRTILTATTGRSVQAFAFPKVVTSHHTIKLVSMSRTAEMHVHQSGSVRYISRSSKVMMSIVDDVTAEMKVAMKAKDSVTLGTIRLIRTAFANTAIELRTETLTDEQALVALRKMAKMRKESIDMYESNGASDRADVERAELAVIERYLPAAVSDDVVREWAKEAIAEAGVVNNIGKVMGAFMRKHKLDVDGSVAQRIVKEEIEKTKQV